MLQTQLVVCRCWSNLCVWVLVLIWLCVLGMRRCGYGHVCIWVCKWACLQVRVDMGVAAGVGLTVLVGGCGCDVGVGVLWVWM